MGDLCIFALGDQVYGVNVVFQTSSQPNTTQRATTSLEINPELYSHLERRGSWEVIVLWQSLWRYRKGSPSTLSHTHTNIQTMRLSLKPEATAPSGTEMDEVSDQNLSTETQEPVNLTKPHHGQPFELHTWPTAARHPLRLGFRKLAARRNLSFRKSGAADRSRQKNWLHKSEPSGRTIGSQFINFKSSFTFSAV